MKVGFYSWGRIDSKNAGKGDAERICDKEREGCGFVHWPSRDLDAHLLRLTLCFNTRANEQGE
jgi:hypothetical protein